MCIISDYFRNIEVCPFNFTFQAFPFSNPLQESETLMSTQEIKSHSLVLIWLLRGAYSNTLLCFSNK